MEYLDVDPQPERVVILGCMVIGCLVSTLLPLYLMVYSMEQLLSPRNLPVKALDHAVDRLESKKV
ncbi:MAG: hypothetical protein ACO24L_06400, partial [Polynucleobacter sp.]